MSYRRFLILFLLAACLFALPFALHALLVVRSGEMLSFAEVAHLQRSQGVFFGPAFNTDEFPYKLALYAEAKPDITAVGSSRVLSFREEFFTSSFVGCGRAADDLKEMESFVELMLGAHVPKVVLLGVDFWWFRYEENLDRRYEPILGQGDQWSWAKMARAWQLLWRGKLRLETVWAVLLHGLPPDRIGLLSYQGRGFRPDGSIDYGAHGGDIPDDRAQLQAVTDKIVREHKHRWTPADHAHDTNFLMLRRIVDRLEEAGCHVVIIFPPLVSEMARAIEAHPDLYSYVPEIVPGLERYGLVVHDYFDGGRLGSDFQEFHDSIHGGEVTFLRILADLADKDSQLASMVDLPKIQEAIKQFVGQPSLPYPFLEF